MKYFAFICCMLASVTAKDKKISLEDIENENLKANQSPGVPVGTPANYAFAPIKTANDYARQQQYVPPQQYTPPPQQYQQYYYPQYQQLANLQYVSDNSIAQRQQQQYTPQYVYYQQYTAPSTAIQSIVDPKGGIQYIMYVPAYVPTAEQTQTVENVIYTNGNQQSYVLPQAPSIKYVQPQEQPQIYNRQEPKSLLDSYVPSLLQVQYYKQQQSQANAIQQSLKEVDSQAKRTNGFKSGYRPTQTNGNGAGNILNYSYENPNIQQKYN